MKKIITALSLSAALVLSGCSSSDAVSTDTNSADATTPVAATTIATSEAPKAPDLAGGWVQSNKASEDSYQQATIEGKTISIDWISDGGKTKAVYWVGTFVAPKDAAAYSWESVRDAAATDNALMASTDDTKKFSYKDGVITYEVSALGMTKSVDLKRR